MAPMLFSQPDFLNSGGSFRNVSDSFSHFGLFFVLTVLKKDLLG
jgi:hypothetical protein